jgi:hypothetical protein
MEISNPFNKNVNVTLIQNSWFQSYQNCSVLQNVQSTEAVRYCNQTVSVMLYRWKILTWINQRIQCKTCTSVYFSTKKPLTDPLLRNETPLTNGLIHSTYVVTPRPLVTNLTWWIKCNSIPSVYLRVVICIYQHMQINLSNYRLFSNINSPISFSDKSSSTVRCQHKGIYYISAYNYLFIVLKIVK